MNLDEARGVAKKQHQKLIDDILSVQPIDVDITPLFNGPSKKELIDAGYVPVSSLGIMWIKKEL